MHSSKAAFSLATLILLSCSPRVTEPCQVLTKAEIASLTGQTLSGEGSRQVMPPIETTEVVNCEWNEATEYFSLTLFLGSEAKFEGQRACNGPTHVYNRGLSLGGSGCGFRQTSGETYSGAHVTNGAGTVGFLVSTSRSLTAKQVELLSQSVASRVF